MELKRVLIQGKPYPVLYDMYGLARIMDEANVTFGELLEKVGRFETLADLKGEDLRFVYDLIWVGFAEGCEEEGIDFPYTKRQLTKHIPLIGDRMNEIMAEFQKGMSSDIDQDDQKKAPVKTKKAKAK